MYRRILFVGLGGSGGKTLRFLKEDLREWLTRVGWPSDDQIPRGFQFLHIDTPTAEDGAEITNIKMLDDSEYVGLIGPNVTLTSVVHGVDNGANYLETAGWRVDPGAVHVSIQDGAGQYRAVGRTIAVSQIAQLKKGLSDAISRINSQEAISDNIRLWNDAGNQGNQDLEAPLAVVISSLAGGTGAGLLIDVCDALRMLQPSWGGSSIGILYTPEVFSNINPAYTGGVHANSLAAFTELLNGYYLKGTAAGAVGQIGDGFIGVRRSKFLASAGLNAGVERSGPQYPFLVGRSNSANMKYAEDKEVFAAMGSVLSLLCRDVAIQEKIQKMTFENWEGQANNNIGSADLLVTKGPAAERGKAVFQALGCAKVSVGTNYLKRYAAARLARESYRWITRYHIDEADGRALEAEGIKDPKDRAREIAKKHVGWFLKIAGLDERGFERNDVTKYLTPEEFPVEIAKASEEVKRIINGGQRMTADAWLEQIRANVGLVIDALELTVMPQVDRQVASWVKERPDSLTKATEQSIAQYGLLVTSEILRLTKNELVDPATGIAAELMGATELEYFVTQSQETQWMAAAQAELSGVRGKFTLEGNESVARAVDAAVNGASQRIDARIREISALLIREFTDSVIEPLIAATSRAYEDVSIQVDEVKSWPEWTYETDSPSAEFRPFKNEITLIEPEQFGSEFVKQLALSMNGSVAEREDHRKEARVDVISGKFIRDVAEEQKRESTEVALLKRAKWSPTHNVIRESTQSKFEVEVRMSPEDLKHRAELWLGRQGTTLQGFLAQGLGTYTQRAGVNANVSQEEIQKRQSDFKAKLASAVQLSAPLVELNAQLQQALSTPSDSERSFSQLPFAEPHPLAKDVLAIVRNYMPQDQIPAGLITSSDAQTIEVISALPGPQQPVLLSSLLRPIGEKWSAVNTADQAKTSFWTFRRARLTSEAIPAPQGHIVAMIRGWFTAHAFGLLEIPTDGRSPIKIAHWEANLHPANFPFPMLSSASDNVDSGRTEGNLFSVLESLGLALVAVCEQSNSSPLNAYIALRDYGLSVPHSNDEPILGYSAPNPLIREWIRSGTLKTSNARGESQLRQGLNATIRPNLAGHATPEARAGALKQHFSNQLKWLFDKEQEFLDSVKVERTQLNYTKKWQTLLSSSDGTNHLVRAVSALERSIDKWQE